MIKIWILIFVFYGIVGGTYPLTNCFSYTKYTSMRAVNPGVYEKVTAAPAVRIFGPACGWRSRNGEMSEPSSRMTRAGRHNRSITLLTAGKTTAGARSIIMCSTRRAMWCSCGIRTTRWWRTTSMMPGASCFTCMITRVQRLPMPIISPI